MAKKKPQPVPNPVCGKCGKVIIRNEVLDALQNGHRYIHGCGKQLVAGDDRLKVEDVK